MRIKKLQIQNFRNIKRAHLHLSPSLNFFIGDNGQGKTNLLESIHTLLKGQMIRTGQFEQVIPLHEPDSAIRILAEFDFHELHHHIEFQYQTGRQRKFILNQKNISSGKLASQFPILVFAPESLSAIKDGPQERRDLIDDWVRLSDPHSIKIITEYNKCLKTRNQILRDRLSKKIPEDIAAKTLKSIHPFYVQLATQLTKKRLQSIELIGNHFAETMNYLWPDLKPGAQIIYGNEQGTILQDFHSEKMAQAVNEKLPLELKLGRSIVGPHRHDIRVLFSGQDSRLYASQGQQRSLILGFKIAQVRCYGEKFGEYPLILLDDVMSELDHQRRYFMTNFLRNIKTQVFLTTTELSSLEGFDQNNVALFQVQKGEFENRYVKAEGEVHV